MLKIHENTATNILLTAVVFFLVVFLFYPFFVRSRIGLENFLASTFFNKNDVINDSVGNVYTVKVNPTFIEPEEIYIYQDDVLKIVNNSGRILDFKINSDVFLDFTLRPGSENFTKFDNPGEYTYSINDSNTRSEILSVYVK